MFWKCAANLQENTHAEVLSWVFFCKFAAYFQNTFSKEHLWVAAFAVYQANMAYGNRKVWGKIEEDM